MELLVGTLPALFSLIKKSYKAYDGCIFVQVRFKLEHDALEYIYVLSGLFDCEREETFYLDCEYEPIDMDKSTALFLVQELVGLRNVFNLFKEEIYEMLQAELDKFEYAHLRFVFLPV